MTMSENSVRCQAVVYTQYSIYVGSHVDHKLIEDQFYVCSTFTSHSTMLDIRQVFNEYFLYGELSINTPSFQMRKLCSQGLIGSDLCY